MDEQFFINQFRLMSEDFHKKIDESVGGVYKELKKCREEKAKCVERFHEIETSLEVKAAVNGVKETERQESSKFWMYLIRTVSVCGIIAFIAAVFRLLFMHPASVIKG